MTKLQVGRGRRKVWEHPLFLQLKIRVGGLDKLQQLLRVLADEGLGVVAGNVVPLDPVVVDVVQQAHARLHAAVDVELGVVRLAHVLALELGLVSGE